MNMTKTNLLRSNMMKSAVMLLLAAVMMFVVTITAYADYNGGNDYEDNPYGVSTPTDMESTPPNQESQPPTQEPPMQEPPMQEPPIQESPLGSLVIINSTHDGHLLPGAVFALYRTGENVRLAEMATDTAGRTQEIPLPHGNYTIVVLMPSHNHMSIADRIGVTITAGQRQEITIFSMPIPSPTPSPTPQPTPPPTVEVGRLLITLRAHGTNELLSGAVFEVRSIMDNEVVATLVTDGFGEAAVNLPIGDYFIRELQAPIGFTPNPDRINFRIAANRLNEINLISRPIPEPTPPAAQTPPPQETLPEPGRLIITARAEGTRELLPGIGFEVRRAIDNRLMAEIVTDRFGEAAATLPPGDYHVRQITAIQGFYANSDRVNVRIAAGTINEIIIINSPVTVTPPPEQEAPPEEVQNGRLLITLTSSAGERLEGAIFSIHHRMTDELTATVVTNRFGEASINLPPGEFFMRQASVPQGYRASADRLNFIVRSAEVSDISVVVQAIEPTPAEPQATPEPTPTPQTTTQSTTQANRPVTVTQSTTAAPQRQGNIEIMARAEQSGNPIIGVTFGVYRVSDNARITEITTDMNGLAAMSLSPGEYYLRNYAVPFGFIHERARIFFTVSGTGMVRIDVTAQRDWNIPYADYGHIILPQTGELLPIWNYVSGAVFVSLGVLLIVKLWRDGKSDHDRINGRDSRGKRRRNRNIDRKGAKSYA